MWPTFSRLAMPLQEGSLSGAITHFWSTACGGRGIDYSNESGQSLPVALGMRTNGVGSLGRATLTENPIAFALLPVDDTDWLVSSQTVPQPLMPRRDRYVSLLYRRRGQCQHRLHTTDGCWHRIPSGRHLWTWWWRHGVRHTGGRVYHRGQGRNLRRSLRICPTRMQPCDDPTQRDRLLGRRFYESLGAVRHRSWMQRGRGCLVCARPTLVCMGSEQL